MLSMDQSDTDIDDLFSSFSFPPLPDLESISLCAIDFSVQPGDLDDSQRLPSGFSFSANQLEQDGFQEFMSSAAVVDPVCPLADEPGESEIASWLNLDED